MKSEKTPSPMAEERPEEESTKALKKGLKKKKESPGSFIEKAATSITPKSILAGLDKPLVESLEQEETAEAKISPEELKELAPKGEKSPEAAQKEWKEKIADMEEKERRKIAYANKITDMAKEIADPFMLSQKIKQIMNLPENKFFSKFLITEALSEAERQELIDAQNNPDYEKKYEEIEKKYEETAKFAGIISKEEGSYIGRALATKEKSPKDIKIALEREMESLTNDFCKFLGKDILPNKQMQKILEAGDAIDQIEELLDAIGGAKGAENLDIEIRKKMFNEIMGALAKAEARESIEVFQEAKGQLDLLPEKERKEILRKDLEIEKKYNNARRNFFKAFGMEGTGYEIQED